MSTRPRRAPWFREPAPPIDVCRDCGGEARIEFDVGRMVYAMAIEGAEAYCCVLPSGRNRYCHTKLAGWMSPLGEVNGDGAMLANRELRHWAESNTRWFCTTDDGRGMEVFVASTDPRALDGSEP